MTDVSSVKAHADPQPASTLLSGDLPLSSYTNGSPALDGTVEDEESSTIKCICGFSDDDGNTVLCEKCDTWQHIVCYYESAHNVPDVHECTDCQPRAVDRKSATEKQLQRRELHNFSERKGKPKATTKNHKKRTKEGPLGAVQPNGWAVHSNNDLYYNSERKSGSPRDQQPPSKRPKTSHRTSGSVGNFSQAPALVPGSRKRANSTMHNGHSPVKSPTHTESSNEEFSPEFMNLYRHQEPRPTDSNLYTDIGVANDISTWLNDRVALAEATGGLQPGQVFQRIDQPIEQLESLAPAKIKQVDEDVSITKHGLHPQWHYLTVDRPVPVHSYIGELRGRIGRKEDYFSDPANRWDHLRHPEPFVFFPPHLPIYIDTRHEGTMLRYARRSCNPNMQMNILMQGPESGFHFCFIATKDIEPGEALTVGWEIDSEIRQRLNDVLHNGDIRKEGLKMIEPWVAGVLSNFGGCACDTSRRECLLERARRPNNVHTTEPSPPTKTKGRKSKKPQISPLSTGHATNSRAGSEAFGRNVGEDDNVDCHSTSGSHKSTSRDITPATHFSVDGGDLKLSDRERRKIQQQERLFEQLEYEEQHKGRKGKRNSAGSALNTPGLSTSKQIGQPEPSPSTRLPREHSNGVARKPSGSSRTNGRSAPKPKPAYVDSSTQTGDCQTSASPNPSPAVKARVIKRPLSFKHKLLQQAMEDRIQRDRNRSASVKTEAQSPALKDVASNKPSPAPPSAPEESSAMDISTDADATVASVATEIPVVENSSPLPTPDSEMKDVETGTSPRPPSLAPEAVPDAVKSEPPSTTADNLVQAPAPALPTTSPTAPAVPSTTADAPSPKPIDLRVQPPPPELTNTIPSANSAITPISGGAIAQSPVGMSGALSPFSPSVASATNPGPARKKLSLSDYTSRRAKLAQTHSGTSATPPLAQSQATSSPTLSTTSLPNQTSPPAKTPEPAALPAVTEESKTAD